VSKIGNYISGNFQESGPRNAQTQAAGPLCIFNILEMVNGVINHLIYLRKYLPTMFSYAYLNIHQRLRFIT